MTAYRKLLLAAASLTVAAVSATAQPRAFGEDVVDSIKTEKVFLPINHTMDRATITGGAKSFEGSTLEKYPTFDIVNSMTGLIPGLHITESAGSIGVRYRSSVINATSRNHAPVVMVDDVPTTNYNEIQLNPEEIESVTLVNDIVDKLRFGPEAANGVIYIRTLRGVTDKRVMKVGFEKGIDVVDRIPEWCDGVEYATLNNLARQNYNTLTGTETYPILYSQEDIAGFAKKDPYDLDTPNVDYKSLLLKNTKQYNKAFVLIRGGNNDVRYSGNAGWVNSGDIFNTDVIGYDGNFNRFNAKMDIDITINPKLKANVSFIGTYSMRKSPGIYGSYGLANDLNTLLQHILTVPATAYPLWLGTDEETGKTIYAVTSTFPNNPYAEIVNTGGYKDSYRAGVTRANLEYDLSALLKNLKSETQLSYKVAHSNRIGQAASNIIMLYNKEDHSTEITSNQGQRESEAVVRSTDYLQSIQFHEKLKYNLEKGKHSLDTYLAYYISKLEVGWSSSYRKQQNGIFSASYNYGRKYLLDIAANYSGSSSLKKGNRYRLFPSVGLGWVLTEEDFLENSSWLSFLKLRGQAGIIGVEKYGDQFLWESYYQKGSGITYGPYATNQWFGSTSSESKNSLSARVENPSLDWEKNREISVGIDAVLFKKLEMTLSYYNILQYDAVQSVTAILPSFLGATTMYDNYGSVSFSGEELSLNWSDKVGDFKYSIGGWAMHPRSHYEKYMQLPTYDNLMRAGTSTSAIWGLHYLGRFKDQADIDNSCPQTFDPVTYPGDLKYEDINGDGVVNNNDQTIIGDSAPKLDWALNLYLSYKNWELSAVGTGQAWQSTILSSSYFRSGAGDSNYSKWVKQAVESGFYPRFSYIDSSNNMVSSEYWKSKVGWFKLQNVELAYTFGFKDNNAIGVKNIRVFARGANLLTISPLKDVDPESTSSGFSVYPLFKTVTGGFRLTF